MILALLGLDDDTLAIARAAAANPLHRISMVCDLPPNGSAQLEAAGIRGFQTSPWESLMASGGCDAVVVASAQPSESHDAEAAEELRTEQLRRLTQEGVPLLVAHPVLSSVLGCYEIDMIRREAGGIVLPYVPSRWDETILRLAELLRDPAQSPVGKIEQIVFERSAKNRIRRTVLAHFARDVDLIRALTGEIRRIGVLASANPDAAYANLTVQMSGDDATFIRWSIIPHDNTSPRRLENERAGGSSGLLRIIGAKDRLELQPPGERAPGARGERPDDLEAADLASPFDGPAAALERLAEAVASGEPCVEWTEAIRDLELADAIPRSLVRGRTIEVQHEQPTEEGTFKGLMTSLGCGLLLIGLAAVVVLALLDAVANANHWQKLSAILRPWPWFLCGVFGLFLMFQLLLRLAKRDECDRNDDESIR